MSRATLLAACLAAFAGVSHAQSTAAAGAYPTKPIRFIIPFSAGGGTDVTARLLAEQMGAKLGQPVVSENRPGASANLGATLVAREKPDGYTLLVGTATLATNSVIGGSATPFDLLNDFEFIGKIGQIDLIVYVPTKLKIDTLEALVNQMRTQPGKVQFGSPGIGSLAHLAGEELKLVTKGDALHIPYKGESAAVTDLIGGQITFQFCAPFVCQPRVLDGSLKSLAIANKRRSKVAPDVPTTAETGFPGVEAGTWYFLAAPKGTPAPILAKLTAALNEVMADEKYRTRLLTMGVETEPGTSGPSVKIGLQAEMEKWRPVIKAAAITLN